MDVFSRDFDRNFMSSMFGLKIDTCTEAMSGIAPYIFHLILIRDSVTWVVFTTILIFGISKQGNRNYNLDKDKTLNFSCTFFSLYKQLMCTWDGVFFSMKILSSLFILFSSYDFKDCLKYVRNASDDSKQSLLVCSTTYFTTAKSCFFSK